MIIKTLWWEKLCITEEEAIDTSFTNFSKKIVFQLKV